MKSILLPVAVSTLACALAACGSSGSSGSAGAPGASGGIAGGANGAMMYFSSRRAPGDVAACLQQRLPRVSSAGADTAVQLAVGSTSRTSYYVTLTPATIGTVIRVTRAAHGADDPPEEEMRFIVARCTT